jgi:heme oxygenase
MSGNISKQEYKAYLCQQLLIFSSIEEKRRFPLPHESLKRLTNIFRDLSELDKMIIKMRTSGESMNDLTTSTPTYNELTNSTRTYVDYLKRLNQKQLLPHVYLNYLALMFGGQMMKDKVPGSGRIYQFDNLQDAIMSIRSIQQDDWQYEVNKGFTYIIGMFNELQTIFGLPS